MTLAGLAGDEDSESEVVEDDDDEEDEGSISNLYFGLVDLTCLLVAGGVTREGFSIFLDSISLSIYSE